LTKIVSLVLCNIIVIFIWLDCAFEGTGSLLFYWPLLISLVTVSLIFVLREGGFLSVLD
jgi:hypothetical protein